VDAGVLAAEAHPDIVVGFSLGNEMIFARRRSFAELAAAAVNLKRRLSRVPVSTTEPFHMYYEPAAATLLRELDFLLVNIHPVFQPWFRDAPDSSAAQFVVNVTAKLRDSFCGPILVKETGVPTAPAAMGFTLQRQAGFFRELRLQFPASGERAFAYFSAFDAPWRAYDELPAPGGEPTAASHASEAHWGLYDENRRPKPVVGQIPQLVAAGTSRGR
jgi:exo-beta-1,3-glucanase (GH17 family)